MILTLTFSFWICFFVLGTLDFSIRDWCFVPGSHWKSHSQSLFLPKGHCTINSLSVMSEKINSLHICSYHWEFLGTFFCRLSCSDLWTKTISQCLCSFPVLLLSFKQSTDDHFSPLQWFLPNSNKFIKLFNCQFFHHL